MKIITVKNLGNTKIYLHKYLASLNLTSPFKLIKKRVTYINDKKANTSSKVADQDIIKIYANIDIEEKQNLNEIYKIPIIYEDENLIAINKPKGIASQGGMNIKISIDKIFPKYKLVHRLDKDTDGVMLLAKTLYAAQRLTEAFKDRKIYKYYELEAFFFQPLKIEKGVINNSHGTSKYKVISKTDNIYHIHVQPITGKKHQIRLHINALGGHILGDKLYTPASSPYQRIRKLKLRCYEILILQNVFYLSHNLTINIK